jgi:hypothetical protein
MDEPAANTLPFLLRIRWIVPRLADTIHAHTRTETD